jgi:hypothetical protein
MNLANNRSCLTRYFYIRAGSTASTSHTSTVFYVKGTRCRRSGGRNDFGRDLGPVEAAAAAVMGGPPRPAPAEPSSTLAAAWACASAFRARHTFACRRAAGYIRRKYLSASCFRTRARSSSARREPCSHLRLNASLEKKYRRLHIRPWAASSGASCRFRLARCVLVNQTRNRLR